MLAVLAVSALLWAYSSVHSLFKTNSTNNIGVIVTAVEACAEMTTYRAYFESIADLSEKGWIWDRKFAVIFGGTVDCGFDMRKAKAEIFEEEKKIEITLPHCYVLRANVDIKTMRVYDEKGSHKLEEQNAVIVRAQEEIQERATKEWNILVLAEDNAVKIYKDFLKSFNYEVSVVFTDDESKLNVPSGNKIDTMKGGGVLVVHTAPEKESKEAKK
ncbi:MAG: DUF4230 domain-containing protein [Synergistaceae bacterium]|nr:DUF4230 domain-containing protein [Synergistaceae bacterium]